MVELTTTARDELKKILEEKPDTGVRIYVAGFG